MIRAIARFFGLFAASLELLHLRWARKEMHPLHPDLPDVVRRIHQLERSTR